MVNSVAKRAEVWIDETRCTGCGACAEVCPTGAIALVEGKARLNSEQCQGCEACVQVCPTGALQPVLKPELVNQRDINQRDIVSTSPHPPEVQSKPGQLAPLRDAAIATAVAAGTKLVMQVVPALARTLTRTLSRALSSVSESPVVHTPSQAKTTGQRLNRGGGRRARHRRRGRR
jgi:Fe-S-cluster-containing hydrogenase component 2